MSQEIVPVDLQAWLGLSFGEQRQHGGNVGYRDDPERVYRYDSFVPNHRRVSPGHLLVIAGRDGLIGFARIERIERLRGTKTFLRCPARRTSGIKKRSSAKLLFRCNHGHEFDVPDGPRDQSSRWQAGFIFRNIKIRLVEGQGFNQVSVALENVADLAGHGSVTQEVGREEHGAGT